MTHLTPNRSRFLLGCGSMALALALAAAPQEAQAQAFQGNEEPIVGSANRIFTGTGTETIVVETDTAVLDWTPLEDGAGNALDFLPTGNVATFENGVNVQNFAILNRILPSTNGNVVVFDGTVISVLVDALGARSPGGTVAFYSPTGILVGPNAAFDVGNLILTTLDPDLASFDNFALNGGTLIQSSPGSTASIIISPGANIAATPENSYFAVTAAEIQMFGTTNVNGSQAYVAGETVNITISNGLFDIAIPVGTSVGTPIVMDGNVGGPSSTGLGDNHLIYAVAAAQNDPISLLFSGNLGFAPAAAAGIVNGEIILSANYGVSGRLVDSVTVDGTTLDRFTGIAAQTATLGSIFVEDFVSTSTLMAVANDTVFVGATAVPSSVAGNLLAFANNIAQVSAINGQTFDITGFASVGSTTDGQTGANVLPIATNGVGGLALLGAGSGGALTVGGDVRLRANAQSGQDINTATSGTATGGTAEIFADGGTVNIAGRADLFANGFAGIQVVNQLVGADHTGGIAEIIASLGGSVTVQGEVFLQANADGGDGDPVFLSSGSNAFAGEARLTVLDGASLIFNSNVDMFATAFAGSGTSLAQGAIADAGSAGIFIDTVGTVDIAGALVLAANAIGGDNAAGQGGDALGGAARLFVPNGGSVTIGTNFLAEADAFGGNGIGGGNAFGGIAGAQVIAGLIDITGNARATAEAFGGDGLAGNGGDGGVGTGGNSFLQADGTLVSVGTLTIGGNAGVNSSGRGGDGGTGNGDNAFPGNGGDGIGGQIGTPNQADPQFGNGAYILGGGDNGNISVGGATSVTNFGIGGNGAAGGIGEIGGNGGNGIGGTAQAGQAILGGDGSVGAGTASFGVVQVISDGTGGTGGAGVIANGDGGNGDGFNAFFTARGGTVSATDITISAGGSGGVGENGGIGTGGFASLQGALGAILSANNIDILANGRGQDGLTNGGAAFGGNANMNFLGLQVDIAGTLLMEANALGGFSFGGLGGEATGGLVNIELIDNASTLNSGTSTVLSAEALAGSSNSGLAGAQATGGNVNLLVDGTSSANFAGMLTLDAGATGGNSNGGGIGGTAVGRNASVLVDNGGTITVDGDLQASSIAFGGNGTGGGDAFGGLAEVSALSGLIDILGSVATNASATGGDSTSIGGDGGLGQGGTARVRAVGTLTDVATVRIGGAASAFATGQGGDGGNGLIADGEILPGRGGDGLGGNTATPRVNSPNSVTGAFITAGGDNGNLIIGTTALLSAQGFGGDGGTGDAAQAGGDGGVGVGGNASAGLFTFNGDGSIGAGTMTFGDLIVDTFGLGGDGGFGGGTGDPFGNGGAGTGGDSFLAVRFGTVSGGTISFGADGVGGQGETGGDGTGGRSGIFGTPGLNGPASLTVSSYFGTGNGRGGVGLGGSGGIGTGGAAFLGVQGMDALINGDVDLEASGFGGDSTNADGAAGIGGIANIAVFNTDPGNGTVLGNASIVANGIGGEADIGFTGGTGSGGNSFIQAQVGGSLTFGSTQVTASGQGGSGFLANGGDGIGGIAEILSLDPDSVITILNNTPFADFGDDFNRGAIVAAVGLGGETSGASGVGGTGTGGSALVSATTGGTIVLPADPAGDPNSFAESGVVARGFGGNTTVDGGVGGLGEGGIASFLSDGGFIQAGAINLSAFGAGGEDAGGAIDTDGGDGRGGLREIIIRNAGVITAEFSGGVAGGLGGRGTGTGVGGDGIGGSSVLNVQDGTLNLVGRSGFADQSSGGSGSIGGDAIGGNVDVTITNSTVTIAPNALGQAVVFFGGPVFGGDGITQGGNAQGADVNILFSETNVSGGAIQVTSSAVGGNADIVVGTGGDATGGDIFVVGTLAQINLTGENIISSFALGGAGNVGGNAIGGFSSLDILQTDMTVTADGNGAASLDIESVASSGQGDPTSGDAFAGTAQLLMLDASLSTTDLLLAAEANAASALGSVGDGGLAQGGLVEPIIEGASTLSATNLILSSDGLSSAGGTANGGLTGLFIGSVGGTEDVSVGTAQISANGFGGDGLDQAGRFLIDVESGQFFADILTAQALSDTVNPNLLESALVARGGDLLIGTSLTVDVLDNFLVESVQGSLIGGPTVFDPTAAISITSQETISFVGDNDNVIGFGGLSLDLAARDIDIEDGARIGAFSMNFTSLNTNNPAILGGDAGSDAPGPGEGFVLSLAEGARIEVGDFSFTQAVLPEAGPNDPTIIIRDITIFGTLDDGTSSVSVQTEGVGGIIRVEGVVAYVDAAPTDSLSFFADERIEIVTPGGIGIVDPSGNPTGSLFLTSNNIWAADADLIGQLQVDPFFAGRDELLRVAAVGSEDPLGFIRGGTVDIQVGQSLLVRNTGTTSEQGGILVGDGGLSIGGFSSDSPGTGEPLDVFAYGARTDASGNLVTGANFYLEVNFNNADTGGVSYRETAEFNDCIINTDECSQFFGVTPEEQEIIEEILVSVNNPTVIKTVVSSAIPQGTTSNPEGITSVSASNPQVLTNIYSSNPPVIGLEESNDEFGLDFPGLIEAPELGNEAALEDPVASGGDSSLYGQGTPDENQGGGN